MGDETGTESASGESLRPCELCHRPLAGEHFRVRDLLVCAECAADLARPAAAADWLRRALSRGVGASMGVALAWYLATRITSLDLAPLAVVAGIIVGLTVRRSVAGRGGWRVQLLALALTYLAVCVRFVPSVFQGMGDAIRTSQVRDAPASAPPAPTVGQMPAQAATEPPRASPPTDTSVASTLLAYFLFTLVAWGLVLAGPFVAGFSVAGALSTVAGLYLAWRLNRAAPVQGPFGDSAVST